MMRIEDLSIGDWVKIDGVSKRVHSIEYQNGFVKWHPLSNARQLKGEDFIVNITDPSNINTAFITINRGLYKVVLPALSSVHQLQHALRLAGVEKELKL